MIRKNIRLRREYLYNMEHEKKNQLKYKQKMLVKNAMAGKHACTNNERTLSLC